jgi:hypothetical protein
MTSDSKKKSGMSESDEESANLGAVPMLEYISRELKEAQEHVTKLIQSERRRREENEVMTDALRKVRRRVDAVREQLEQLPQNEPEIGGRRRGRDAEEEEEEIGEREEGQNEEQDQGEQEEGELEQEEEQGQEEEVVAKQKEKPAKRGRGKQMQGEKKQEKNQETRQSKRQERRREKEAVKEKEKEEEQEEEEEEEGDKELSNERELKKLKGNGRLIADGVAGRTEEGLLVYFSLNADVVKQTGKQLVCPSRNDEGTVAVARRSLVQAEYGNLAGEEQQWYLDQLLNDIVLRFKINFPILFANFGVDMIQARTSLVKNPTNAALLVDVFAARVVEAKLAMKVSPSLSAANNTAIMLAAVLHENLSKEKAKGWHEEFEKHLKSICKWCTLSPKTIDRSRGAAKLMLRSNVIACLLPSFVVLLSRPIGVLLDDSERSQRLEAVFADEMGRYANEFEETRQIVLGPRNKAIGEAEGMVEDGEGLEREAGRLLQIEAQHEPQRQQKEQVQGAEKLVPTVKLRRKNARR